MIEIKKIIIPKVNMSKNEKSAEKYDNTNSSIKTLNIKIINLMVKKQNDKKTATTFNIYLGNDPILQ